MDTEQKVCRPNVNYERSLSPNQRGYFEERGEISCEGCGIRQAYPILPAVEVGSPDENFKMRMVLLIMNAGCSTFRDRFFPRVYKAFQDVGGDFILATLGELRRISLSESGKNRVK